MPIVINNTLDQIRGLAMGGDDRAVKGERLAELVQTLGSYRWVGSTTFARSKFPSSRGWALTRPSSQRFQ